ncbi:hypothetical protein ACEYYB_08745 [Paracoccus sp. p4-l81]|uniref:hypothetical protein n=1 Tax=unclassified Paracoccus (in: a-proteobacteria) TaxID=2688777 RepID=UPI0035B94F89
MSRTARLDRGQFRAGQWVGTFVGPDQPQVAVTLNGAPLDGLAVDVAAQGDDRWQVSFPVPAQALTDGVQSFVIADAASGDRLAVATILTGIPVDDDLRAEIALLRAELELVKRSLRRLASDG